MLLPGLGEAIVGVKDMGDHETQMEVVGQDILRGMIRSRGEKRPAKADGALPKAKARKAKK
jgi:hypothetical protein